MRFDRREKTCYVVALALIVITAALFYYFHRRGATDGFTCFASLSQHYSDDSVDVSLSYTVRGDSGIISVSGRSTQDTSKVFNRKISFIFNKKDDVYYMTSESNLKFPDDNVDDAWLSVREPDFFVYPYKSIYMRIVPLNTKSYLFMIDTIPTYICNSVVG